jgi:hypothetical protein
MNTMTLDQIKKKAREYADSRNPPLSGTERMEVVDAYIAGATENGWVDVEDANLEQRKQYLGWKEGYIPVVFLYSTGPGTLCDWHSPEGFAPWFIPTHVLPLPPAPNDSDKNKER